jgi:peptidoglycan/xylan/chitin deacetylase (PgdA/CDA1 family)
MLSYLAGAVGAAAAASVAGYHSMAPQSQLYGRTFVHGDRRGKQLALTYDDGPNDPHTLRLLEVLARHNVRATFFLIGRHVALRPNIVRELARAGHVLGNHSQTHPNFIFLSGRQARIEIETCRHNIEDAVGEHSTLFRPPFGGRRPETLRIARAAGLEPVMWDVTAWDWNVVPAAKVEGKVEGKVVRQARGGSVILLHDGGHAQMGADRAHTVAATDHLVTRYKSEGYEFVTIPEMMRGIKV